MNVKLNIENDAELRTYIKDCIKGQVLSIVRDEFLEIVKTELERKIKASENKNLDFMLRTAFKEAALEICYNKLGVNGWSTEFIKPYVDAKVNEALANKDWDRLVNDLAKEKVKSLIK